MKRTAFAGVAVALCLSLYSGLSPADAGKSRYTVKLPAESEAIHVLNRLAFGPRPGDLESVRAMGPRKWAELQLHPERIAENPELAAKLQPLDSLRMTSREIARNYPPQQMIRAVAEGRAQMPDDPVLRVRYQNLAERYKQRTGKKKGGEMAKGAEKPGAALSGILDARQRRTLMRGTPDEKRELLKSLPEDKLEQLLAALPPGIRQRMFVGATTELRRTMLASATPQQVPAHDLWEAKLIRAVHGNRQLEEVLADFWFNHFNVYLDKGANRYLVTEYEREAIRPHLLGKFKDLVTATAKSPAMLFYLDNWQSVDPKAMERMGRRRAAKTKGRTRGLNENYGRELLELHTLGVDGGYTQKDVMEVARCFTGWTIRDPRMGGGFHFEPRVHDRGEKTVLGVKIAAGGGMEDGLKVIEILARHPSTAQFISRKLAQRFVADDPPASLVNRMAETFRKTDGDIREVMRTMLDSREFWSEGAWRAKVKSPLEMVASAIRATGAEVTFAYGVANQVAQLGQPLYRKEEPTGYPNTSDEWVNSSALLARMNFAVALTQNQMPGVKADFSSWSAEDPMRVAARLLLGEPSRETRASIEKALQERAGDDQAKRTALAAGLLLGSPDFQRR